MREKIIVDEKTDVSPHGARFVADAPVQGRVLPVQLLQYGPHCIAAQTQLRLAVTVRLQNTREPERGFHRMNSSH